MATTTSHNKKSSAVKRILSEAREFNASDTEFTASPLEDNIFEWHFTLRGPSSSEFQEGIYHGRILLPAEYPFRPPDVMLLTPNGRWELNKKICLTFTGFHEEMWQPAWGIRTALIGVQAFMGARAEAAVGVGSLDYPEEEREKLAKKSQNWTCPICKLRNSEILAEGESRKEESLPEGLTIDPRSEGAKEREVTQGSTRLPASLENISPVSTATDIPQAPEGGNTAEHEHSFGPLGPPDSLLASIVDGQARRDASLQNASLSSSRVTSGTATPVGEPVTLPSEASVGQEKGKQRQVSESVSLTCSPGSSHDTLSTVRPITHEALPVVPRRVANLVPHNTSEPERRLAVLDRAIATVLFLLLALVLRRVLNAVS